MFVTACAVAAVLIVLAISGLSWLEEQLYYSSLYDLLRKIGRPVQRIGNGIRSSWEMSWVYKAWRWFTFNRVFDLFPIWLAALMLVAIATQITAAVEGISWLFWTILILEAVALIFLMVFVGVFVYFEYVEDSAFAATISGIPVTIKTVGAPITKNTVGILTEWVRDLKDRVCRPIVWINDE